MYCVQGIVLILTYIYYYIYICFKYTYFVTCICVYVLSRVTLCDPMDGILPGSMGFFRQEYWSRLPFPPPGNLPDPGIEPKSPALQADSLPLSHQGNPIIYTYICACTHSQIYSFTHMNLSNPYFNPRKFIFVAQKKKLPTERLRKLPQVTEPESSKRD